MRRAPVAIALACAIAVPLAPAAASAGQLPTADPGQVTTLAKSRIPSSAANARIGQVLGSRTASKILGKRFTMTVWDSATGSYVYGRRANASLRGASTTKILTTVAALATMGAERQLPTTVRAGATADEVVLVGGGDPLLTSADLRRLAADTVAALSASVVTPVPIATTPVATPVPTTPTETTTPATTDPAAAVSIAPVTTPAATTPAAVATFPTKIVVRADDSLFGDQAAKSKGWKASYVPREVRLVGALVRDDRKVRDSTADAGAYFASALRALGVKASYAGETTADPAAATLATFAGHTVGQAVSRTLLISDNDVAEMLFRHVAVARALPATWAGARQAVAATLTELGVPLDGVRIVDGSGLSLDGRLTAPALTIALARAIDPAQPRLAPLRGWLPVAGRSGTLIKAYKRFHAKPSKCAAGLIQAKTGTVADAIALAGYAAGADGSTKVFVSIVNSRPTRYSRVQTRVAVDRAASSVTGCW